MGEDGLAPRPLRVIHPRYHTPATAIWVMAGWASILVLTVAVLEQTGVLVQPGALEKKASSIVSAVGQAGGLQNLWQVGWTAETMIKAETIKSPFDVLTDFAMFGAVIFETSAVLAIFVLRYKMPLAPRPYRCWGYPVVPALYVILPACVLANMFTAQLLEAATGTAFIFAGVVTYYAFGLQKKKEPQMNTDKHG